MKTVGVLALQGDFQAHRKAVEAAGARAIEVRSAAQLEQCDGLIIPGGESTTMLKLLTEEKLFDPVREFGQHKPIYGTCAGAILLAREVTSPDSLAPAQASLGLMDIAVERNAYGRQVDSHIARLQYEGGELEAVFIRAPIIRRVGTGVRVLASHAPSNGRAGDPVWVEQGRHMVTTFHPELTRDGRVHRRFVGGL
jgi:5'-phosphate synthase pdxT subunit